MIAHLEKFSTTMKIEWLALSFPQVIEISTKIITIKCVCLYHERALRIYEMGPGCRCKITFFADSFCFIDRTSQMFLPTYNFVHHGSYSFIQSEREMDSSFNDKCLSLMVCLYLYLSVYLSLGCVYRSSCALLWVRQDLRALKQALICYFPHQITNK